MSVLANITLSILDKNVSIIHFQSHYSQQKCKTLGTAEVERLKETHRLSLIEVGAEQVKAT